MLQTCDSQTKLIVLMIKTERGTLKTHKTVVACMLKTSSIHFAILIEHWLVTGGQTDRHLAMSIVHYIHVLHMHCLVETFRFKTRSNMDVKHVTKTQK